MHLMHERRTNWLPQRRFGVCVTVALQMAVGLSRRSRPKKAPATGPEVSESLPETKNVRADLVSPAESALQLRRGRNIGTVGLTWHGSGCRAIWRAALLAR